MGAPSSPRGARPFLVSGTQTGGLSCVSLDDFALVERYRIASNQVDSRGLTSPSSEAMTHGAIYDLGSTIGFVFHGHCPAIAPCRFAEYSHDPSADPLRHSSNGRGSGRLYRNTFGIIQSLDGRTKWNHRFWAIGLERILDVGYQMRTPSESIQ